jgi:hypothetical protein
MHISDGSRAPPCDAITELVRSAHCRRHTPGDSPDEACQLAGDRGSDHSGRLAAARELAVSCPLKNVFLDYWVRVFRWLERSFV